MRDCKTFVICLLLLIIELRFIPSTINAAPYFYLYGTSSASRYVDQTWLVGLYTDGKTLTAAQTVVNFDKDLLQFVQLNNLNSKCSFWAPADPSLGFGNGTSPYVVTNNKLVISCGFSNPGYMSTNGAGDAIMAFTLKPLQVATSSSMTFSSTELRYIGSSVSAGVSPPFDITIDNLGTPSPTPTPVPTPTPAPQVETLKLSDITTVDISGAASRSGTAIGDNGTGTTISQVPFDNSIPTPPLDMIQRGSATPFPYASQSAAKEEGDILSLQSLKEILIPGNSTADKTLVLFNFIMTITFLVLLAILIWRLLVTRRTNKIKYRHLDELLEGELAVVESKMAGIKEGTSPGEKVEDSFEELINELKSKM